VNNHQNHPVELTATHTLETLSNLKRTAAQFAKQEDQLTRELRQQRHALEQAHAQQTEQLSTALANQREQLIANRDAATDKITQKYNHRRSRIEKAHDESVRFMPRRIRQVRENYLGGLQMRQHRLQQKLALDLENARVNHEQSSAQIKELHTVLSKTVRRTRRYLSGYGSLKNRLESRLKAPSQLNPSVQTAALEESLAQAQSQLNEFRKLPLARFFSQVPLPALFIIILFLCAGLAYVFGADQNALILAGSIALFLWLAVFILQQTGLKSAREQAAPIIELLGQAKDQHAATTSYLSNKLERDHDELQEKYNEAITAIEARRGEVGEVEARFKTRAKDKLENQLPRLDDKIDLALNARIAAVIHAANIEQDRINQEAASLVQQLDQRQQLELIDLTMHETESWQALQQQWQQAVTPAYDHLNAINATPAAQIPDWRADIADTWSPPTDFVDAVKFGRLQLELKTGERPYTPQLPLPGPAQLSAPLALAFPTLGSLLIESPGSADVTVTGTLNHIILRLFATMPPGKVAVTIIDPVGLGKNFAGLMHLGDYEESLINRRIWTQRDQIDERLAELNEHIEKVIQMYLRSEYASITEYNRSAGSVAEKYHFLIIADFPEGFSDTAVRRLQSIAVSGPRCGVYTLIHWDKRATPPDGFVPDELRQSSIVLRQERDQFVLQRPNNQPGALIKLDQPPPPDVAAALVHKIGQGSVDSNRVEVPFSHITPPEADYWTNDTTHELRIPIGRTGATKLQYLAIGKGTRQHALFAGKTGSGKSTLFHVIITNLALSCSPDQVEFYLIDFKKGVEFKCYATKQLPHARVIAIESDREFGLSVLQRVDEELKRRGDLFRKLGVQDIAGYKKNGGTEPIPRTLLLIDEFQEFYTVDDQIAQNASVLFDRIVRQGRAFGIHVLLGSQTLGGAYTLARATLGQMVIRVALQCNEADAYLIMDENNAAPRLLTRPGEGIYNDAAGAIEGNSPFQVVWLDDEDRDAYLDKIHALAEQQHEDRPGPIIFEGNAPADIRENRLLTRLLKTPPSTRPSSSRIWLGAPNAIKGPTEVTFHRQSGNHLLIVGQREEAALTMLGLSLIALAAQHPEGTAQFVFLHSTTPDSREARLLDTVFKQIHHPLTVARAHEIGPVINQLAEELKNRDAENRPDSPTIYLFIHDLHKFKKLRPEDDFSFSLSDDDSPANPAVQLTDLLSQGSTQGIHVVTTIDTYNNVNRFLNRKTLSEFEMRVIFQMSANDSASLIDNPKASDLGLHRALLYNEHEGTLETFRPYAQPEASWFEGIHYA
jgi:S-DNA-T family DNA segregation ATPase FtsK/SpoIIIE